MAISISISDEDHMRAIAVVAGRHAAAIIADTLFEHSREDELIQQVRAQALEKIIAQKEFYELSLDLTLTAIGISSSQLEQVPTNGARSLRKGVLSSVPQDRLASRKYKGSDAATTGSSFDEVSYSSVLTVNLRIEQ
jgi:hypothetical protein